MILSKLRTLANGTRTFYKHCLNNHPYTTQAVQVSLLAGAGDIFAQSLVEKVPLHELNLRRTAEFSCLGLFLIGPSLRFWYGKLDKMISPHQTPWKRTLKKVAFDQLMFAPAFIVIFTSALSTLQGLSTEQIMTRLKADYTNILMTNYMIWPTAQVLNFALVPLNYQVIFVQCVAIVWNTYLSIKLGNKRQKMNAVEA